MCAPAIPSLIASSTTIHPNDLFPYLLELAAILEKERRIPLWQPATLTLCFIGILVLNVLKVRCLLARPLYSDSVLLCD